MDDILDVWLYRGIERDEYTVSKMISNKKLQYTAWHNTWFTVSELERMCVYNCRFVSWIIAFKLHSSPVKSEVTLANL